MKERIQNAMELGEDVDAARERGLDELPSYERDLPSYSSAAAPGGGVGGHMAAATAAPAGMASSIPPPAAPDGPPPGYEEVQMAGLAAGFAGRS